MKAIFQRGFSEYKRQTEIKRSFTRQTERLQAILQAADESNFGASSERTEIYKRPLLLLLPLVEIAWADGRVTRSETEPILCAAEAYGLVENENAYSELMKNLLSRPAPPTVGRMWQDFRYFLENLPDRSRQTVILSLLGQSEFVAEQSSDSVIGFLRGERISNSERDALKSVADQLKKAMAAAESADIKNTVEVSMENEKQIMNYESIKGSEKFVKESEVETRLDDYSQLVPLVPLVKTAWAEGRITKRERQLIFEAAARMGINPGTTAHERLAEWLELHPTEEFYLESLERLRDEWEKLPEDERVLRRLDVLSDCVNIAEASGGTSRYQAGGLRVCDEEIMAVRSIAQKLNSSAAPLSA